MKWLLMGLAIAAGLSNPIQSAANAGLKKSLGQVMPSAIAIYAVALVTLLVVSPFLGLSLRGLPVRAMGAPWWVWLGGICNAVFVLSAAMATQKIGSATFTVTVACCAIVLSLVLDQTGAFGLQPHPINALRMLGGAMAIGGIMLVSLS
jgi:transporter family-2 protein